MKPGENEEMQNSTYLENMEEQYLSDEQLQKLIMEVEELELVTAPGDVLAGVLQKLDGQRQESPCVTTRKQQSGGKVIEFRRYCIRVATSAVAAIALVFTLPGLSNAQKEENLTKPPIVSEQKMKLKQVPHKEERLTKKIGDSRLILDGEIFDIIKNLGGK